MLELLDYESLLRDDVFHQVTDGDETKQVATVQDRQVAEPIFRHQRHPFLAGLVGSHVHDRGRHDFAHARFLRRPSHENDLPRLVAFGDQADYGLAFNDEERANASLRH